MSDLTAPRRTAASRTSSTFATTPHRPHTDPPRIAPEGVSLAKPASEGARAHVEQHVSAADAYRVVADIVSRPVVTDGAAREATDALKRLTPADVPRVLAALTDDERATFYTNLDAGSRRDFVELATRAGMLAPAVVEAQKSAPSTAVLTAPAPPRLVVNDRTFEPALRALVHDENAARATRYAQAYEGYCARYVSEVLERGEPRTVGRRIRDTPLEPRLLPLVEPGTLDDGPLSELRDGWRAARGSDPELSVLSAKVQAMDVARILNADLVHFELRGALKVSENTSLSATARFDAKGDLEHIDVEAKAKVGIVDVAARGRYEDGAMRIEGGTVSTGAGPASIDVEIARDGSAEVDVGVALENESGAARAARATKGNVERQRARADGGHDFSKGGVSFSSEHGGTVGVKTFGAAMELSRDGHAAAGVGVDLGGVLELEAMIHADTSAFTMAAQLATVDDLTTEEIPVRLLERHSWGELPPKTRDALVHEGWDATEWADRRAAVRDAAALRARVGLAGR